MIKMNEWIHGRDFGNKESVIGYHLIFDSNKAFSPIFSFFVVITTKCLSLH